MVKREVIEIVNNYLLYLYKNKYNNIKQAYIFGSYAKGSYNENSDIDLAIVLNGVNDIFDTQIDLLNQRRNDKEYLIEPHPFDELDFYNNPFFTEIKNTGIKINLEKLGIIKK